MQCRFGRVYVGSGGGPPGRRERPPGTLSAGRRIPGTVHLHSSTGLLSLACAFESGIPACHMQLRSCEVRRNST